MADLDSALHYVLRVEVGKFSVLEGQRLVALKKFMAVLAQVSRAPASLVHTSLGSSWSGWTSGPTAVPVRPGLLHCSLSHTLRWARTARDGPLPSPPWAGGWVGQGHLPCGCSR